MIENALRVGSVFARLKRFHMRHLPVGCRLDDAQIGLERFDSQQPVVIGRLILRGDSQPNVVGIKICQGKTPLYSWERSMLKPDFRRVGGAVRGCYVENESRADA